MIAWPSFESNPVSSNPTISSFGASPIIFLSAVPVNVDINELAIAGRRGARNAIVAGVVS